MKSKIIKVVFVCEDCLAEQTMYTSQRVYFLQKKKPNSSGKIPLAFCQGNQSDANFNKNTHAVALQANGKG